MLNELADQVLNYHSLWLTLACHNLVAEQLIPKNFTDLVLKVIMAFITNSVQPLAKMTLYIVVPTDGMHVALNKCCT
jgi:hypothetical protein